VSIIATIHAESYHELLSRNQGKALIGTGAFKTIVILDSRENVGKIKELIRLRGAK
jgi:stage III sporulation protein SpoIIIAA